MIIRDSTTTVSMAQNIPLLLKDKEKNPKEVLAQVNMRLLQPSRRESDPLAWPKES